MSPVPWALISMRASSGNYAMVPEPSTWPLMPIGMTVVSGQLKRLPAGSPSKV